MERDLFKDHAAVLRDHFLNERSRNSRFLVSEKQIMMMVSGRGLKKNVPTSVGGLFLSRNLCWNLHFSKRKPPDFLQMNVTQLFLQSLFKQSTGFSPRESSEPWLDY